MNDIDINKLIIKLLTLVQPIISYSSAGNDSGTWRKSLQQFIEWTIIIEHDENDNVY